MDVHIIWLVHVWVRLDPVERWQREEGAVSRRYVDDLCDESCVHGGAVVWMARSRRPTIARQLPGLQCAVSRLVEKSRLGLKSSRWRITLPVYSLPHPTSLSPTFSFCDALFFATSYLEGECTWKKTVGLIYKGFESMLNSTNDFLSYWLFLCLLSILRFLVFLLPPFIPLYFYLLLPASSRCHEFQCEPT